MDEKNEPLKRFRVGSVTASVWSNSGNMSVTLQKSYKNDEDKWANTQTLFHSDVLCAIKALERAEAFIGSK